MYTGTTADGSDMKLVEGVYVSPCGNYWSSENKTIAEWKAFVSEMSRPDSYRKQKRARRSRSEIKKNQRRRF